MVHRPRSACRSSKAERVGRRGCATVPDGIQGGAGLESNDIENSIERAAVNKWYSILRLTGFLALALAVPALGGPSNAVASISASAKKIANKALKTAKSAQKTANTANSTANSALAEAQKAQTTGTNAQITANSAKSLA